MELRVNGDRRTIDDGRTLLELLTSLDVDAAMAGVAVAVNEAVVIRNEWSHIVLQSGDRVEIIRAVQGG